MSDFTLVSFYLISQSCHTSQVLNIGSFSLCMAACSIAHENQGMVWNGMEDDFSIFHTANFLPFHFYSIPIIFHSIFHSILKFSSIFHSILKFSPYSIPYFHTKEILDWKHCNVYFASWQCCKQPLVKVRITIQRCNNRYRVCILHMV